jgi:hypothetical protein
MGQAWFVGCWVLGVRSWWSPVSVGGSCVISDRRVCLVPMFRFHCQRSFDWCLFLVSKSADCDRVRVRCDFSDDLIAITSPLPRGCAERDDRRIGSKLGTTSQTVEGVFCGVGSGWSGCQWMWGSESVARRVKLIARSDLKAISYRLSQLSWTDRIVLKTAITGSFYKGAIAKRCCFQQIARPVIGHWSIGLFHSSRFIGWWITIDDERQNVFTPCNWSTS